MHGKQRGRVRGLGAHCHSAQQQAAGAQGAEGAAAAAGSGWRLPIAAWPRCTTGVQRSLQRATERRPPPHAVPLRCAVKDRPHLGWCQRAVHAEARTERHPVSKSTQGALSHLLSQLHQRLPLPHLPRPLPRDAGPHPDPLLPPCCHPFFFRPHPPQSHSSTAAAAAAVLRFWKQPPRHGTRRGVAVHSGCSRRGGRDLPAGRGPGWGAVG